MKRFVFIFMLFAINVPLLSENLVPLSVSWNVVESRWQKTSDRRLLFIMNLNYPSRRLPSLSEEEYMACLHEYSRRHPDSQNKKVVEYLKTNPDLNKSPASLVVEVALKNHRITKEQAAVITEEDVTPEKVGEILLSIPELTPMQILPNGGKEYTLSENHVRVIMPDGVVVDQITSDDEFIATFNKLRAATEWLPAKTHLGDGKFAEIVKLKYTDFDINPQRFMRREFAESGFMAMIIVRGGLLEYITFDQIGERMEQATFLTPAIYKKNGFDRGHYFVAWWLNEDGHAIENDSDDSVKLDFDK